MKDHIFISDFDGTISRKDFYWIIIDDYIGEEGRAFYLDWKSKHKIDVPFLNRVFTWHDFTDKEHDDILKKVEIDHNFKTLIKWCESVECDTLVLSAGFRYYIDKVMAVEGLEKIPVITNEGIFKEGHFVIKPDKDAWYYHDVYGVDKETVIKHYKESYKKVYFAGDSEPDYLAALAADVVFAKDELAKMLRENNQKFIEFEEFSEVVDFLERLGFNGLE